MENYIPSTKLSPQDLSFCRHTGNTAPGMTRVWVNGEKRRWRPGLDSVRSAAAVIDNMFVWLKCWCLKLASNM